MSSEQQPSRAEESVSGTGNESWRWNERPAPHPRPTFRAAPLAVPMTTVDETLSCLSGSGPQTPVKDGHSPLQAVPLVKGAQGCIWVLVVEIDGGGHEQEGGVGHIHAPAHLPVQLSHDRIPVRHSCSWPKAGAGGGHTPRGNRQAQRWRVRPPRAQSSSRQDGPSCLRQEPLWVPVSPPHQALLSLHTHRETEARSGVRCARPRGEMQCRKGRAWPCPQMTTQAPCYPGISAQGLRCPHHPNAEGWAGFAGGTSHRRDMRLHRCTSSS